MAQLVIDLLETVEIDEQQPTGTPIPPNDPNWDRLTALAKDARANPAAWLSMTDIFGDLATNPAYVTAFTNAHSSLWSHGTRETLTRYLGDTL